MALVACKRRPAVHDATPAAAAPAPELSDSRDRVPAGPIGTDTIRIAFDIAVPSTVDPVAAAARVMPLLRTTRPVASGTAESPADALVVTPWAATPDDARAIAAATASSDARLAAATGRLGLEAAGTLATSAALYRDLAAAAATAATAVDGWVLPADGRAYTPKQWSAAPPVLDVRFLVSLEHRAGAAATVGMTHLGLPDLSLLDVPPDALATADLLVLSAAQALHQTRAIGPDSSLTIELASLDPAWAARAASAARAAGQPGRAVVTLAPRALPDLPGDRLTIVLPAPRRAAVITALFGPTPAALPGL